MGCTAPSIKGHGMNLPKVLGLEYANIPSVRRFEQDAKYYTSCQLFLLNLFRDEVAVNSGLHLLYGKHWICPTSTITHLQSA